MVGITNSEVLNSFFNKKNSATMNFTTRTQKTFDKVGQSSTRRLKITNYNGVNVMQNSINLNEQRKPISHDETLNR